MRTARSLIVACSVLASACSLTGAADMPPASRPAVMEALSASQVKAVDRSVDRALAWIASRQRADGSFPTLDMGQPGVTALCTLAFLARGHLPGKGPYGDQIDRAVRYVLASQSPDGIISRVHPAGETDLNRLETVAYNHSISGLLLTELYGQTSGDMNDRIHRAIEAAIRVTLRKTPQPKRQKTDEGGWRYPQFHQDSDSDLSVTSWAVMFLRSARNAGFEVKSQPIDEAVQFVSRCYDQKTHVFWYALRGREHVTTRAMTGAGILALSLAGRHQTPEALAAGQWLLEHPFNQYNARIGMHDRFFYGGFYCSQAMFQLGGKYWREFYPVLSRTLVDNQNRDGSWVAEQGYDRIFDNVYSTAMGVLALSPPYQLLPIFQR